MVYSFARVGAALAMKVDDVHVQNRRLWVRLHEKGGKHHEMPYHHNLEAYHATKIGSHSFCATGITAYLKNGGKLERRPAWPTTGNTSRAGYRAPPER
jgi:integrase